MKRRIHDRYKLMFDSAPVALTETDCSALKSHLDRLLSDGVGSVADYYEKHPGEMWECLPLIRPVTANKATLNLFKARSLESLLDRFDDIFTGRSFEFLRWTLAAMSEGRTFFEGQSVNNDLEGNELHLNITWSVCPGCEETYSKVFISFLDVTTRRRTEEALRESEEMYRNLVKTSPDAIVVTDLEANLVYVSQKTLELYGYENEDEVIGTSAFDHFAPEDRGRARENLKRTLEEGFTRNLEYTFLKKDGTRFTGEVNASVVSDAAGNPKVFIATTRDVTQRKKVAEELENSREQLRQLAAHLQSVREGERKRISREIHDELGQVLTAMKMDLSWVESKLPRDAIELHDKIKSLTELADTTLMTVKRISTELRPGLLDDLGVVAAVEWQVEEFEERTGIECELHIEPEEFGLDGEWAITVFRILQEALTNVARHAHASQVEVFLHKRMGNIELIVRDDGEGIEEQQIDSPESLGLTGMRERCYSLGGEIRINSRPGEGTVVEVRIPLLREKVKDDQNTHC